jgi:hypothetical protein
MVTLPADGLDSEKSTPARDEIENTTSAISAAAQDVRSMFLGSLGLVFVLLRNVSSIRRLAKYGDHYRTKKGNVKRNRWFWEGSGFPFAFFRPLKVNDPAGHVQMPGARVLHAPVEGKRWYWANTPSEAVASGFGDEAVIQAIWAADR